MSGRTRSTPILRLGLVFLGVFVLIEVVVGTCGYFAARRVQRVQATEDLGRLAETLGGGYVERLATGDHEAVLSAVRRDAATAEVRISVFDVEGRAIADSSGVTGAGVHPEVETALAGAAGAALRYSPEADAWMLFAARRAGAGPAAPVVRTARSLAHVDAPATTAAWWSLLVGAAAAAVPLGLLFGAAIVTRRQIRTLAAGAEQLAGDRHDARLPSIASGPLAELALSVERVADQLKRRIDQLQVREQEQKVILQSMSNGVIAVDNEQRIMTTNRAALRMFGISDREVEGRLLAEVIRHPELHRLVDSSLTGARSATAEFTVHGDGLITLEALSEPLGGADGEPTGLLVILVDVTHPRRFQSMRSDFAANVSHELRTPITNIKGYVETLQDVGLEDREQASRFLAVIRENSNRLAAIVEDVMDLTKLEQPGAAASIERSVISIESLLGAVGRQFRGPAEERSIALEITVEPGLAISGHGPLLEQAIGNLVSNAIAYSPPDTTVHIVGRGSPTHVTLEIWDQGQGIAREHLDHLFERFYRVDKARSRKQGGTGLGLAIVKHIAQVHGGRVEVESKVGVGSRFRLVLPVDEAATDFQTIS